MKIQGKDGKARLEYLIRKYSNNQKQLIDVLSVDADAIRRILEGLGAQSNNITSYYKGQLRPGEWLFGTPSITIKFYDLQAYNLRRYKDDVVETLETKPAFAKQYYFRNKEDKELDFSIELEKEQTETEVVSRTDNFNMSVEAGIKFRAGSEKTMFGLEVEARTNIGGAVDKTKGSESSTTNTSKCNTNLKVKPQSEVNLEVFVNKVKKKRTAYLQFDFDTKIEITIHTFSKNQYFILNRSPIKKVSKFTCISNFINQVTGSDTDYSNFIEKVDMRDFMEKELEHTANIHYGFIGLDDNKRTIKRIEELVYKEAEDMFFTRKANKISK